MCGIVGYSGPKEPLPILINGLSRLEYRGYDSAGIAISDGNKITVEKKEGKLDVLKNHLKNSNIKEYPQKLINIELNSMPDIKQLEELDNIARILSEEENLDGRYLIRNSGTEPLLRVLVEASEEESVEKFSENLVNKIKNFLQT